MGRPYAEVAGFSILIPAARRSLFLYPRGSSKRNRGLARFQFPLVKQVAEHRHLFTVRCRDVFLFRDIVFKIVECSRELVVAFISSQVFPVTLANRRLSDDILLLTHINCAASKEDYPILRFVGVTQDWWTVNFLMS